MVSSTLLCQVGGLNDVDGMVWELPAPYDKYLLISWYHDQNYGSDEYGCTSTPNIFHIWLVDETQLTGQTLQMFLTSMSLDKNVIHMFCLEHYSL